MPTNEELAECYQAAFRSPDHAWLRPWRFIECRGAEREQLGDILADGVASDSSEITEQASDKLRKGPLRAPLVVICYAHVTQHPKVPVIEQQIAAGCAANNLISALYGLGYGAVWRTGDAAYSQAVHRALKLADTDSIVGILYIGTPISEDKAIPEMEQVDYTTTLSQQLRHN